MPRKHKHNAKHSRYVKPDYHSQNKKETKQQETNKNKLRTSIDIYKRLIHDQTLGIDLGYVSIAYKDRESISKMPLLNWTMIDDGGDIPMHTINYFVFLLMDGEEIILWDKRTRLDRLFCSGETCKRTQSLRAVLSAVHPSNIPKSKSNSHDHDQEFEGVTHCTQYSDEKESNVEEGTNINYTNTIPLLDELIALFTVDMNELEITLSFTKRRVFQEPRLDAKVSRNDYKLIASATKEIMKHKSFIHPDTKRRVNIAKDMEYSYENSELYSENHSFRYINIDKDKLRKYKTMEIEINHETTLDCAYRLTSQYGTDIKIAMLNFSSARNPGGGWDTGAIAQEESIARSSTLIHAITQYETDFYEYHKQRKSMLYSHALIYSPQVVIMKHGNGVAIERGDGCYRCDVITSPAVNAKNYIKRARHTDSMMKKYGQLNKKYKGQSISSEETQAAAWNVVEHVMRERCARVLELAMKYGNEYLILGAWGCGVFGNDSMMIGRIFAELLRDRYHNVFRKVVFAILDQKKKKPLDKFINQFQKVFAKQRRQ
eukprot:74994_1